MFKSIIPNIIYVVLFVVIVSSCSDDGSGEYIQLEGETMGTTYHIEYKPVNKTSYHEDIDSILVAVNNSLSTYIPTSTISRVNGTDSIIIVDSLFMIVLFESIDIYLKTRGAFDPTVMPLVNAWGFGPADSIDIDSAMVDSLLELVNFEGIYPALQKMDSRGVKKQPSILKRDVRIQLDFSAIAKGYGVDLVSEYLERKGVVNYRVEIGGEVRAEGLNDESAPWRFGIINPEEGPFKDEDYKVIAHLSHGSIATSGNYLKFKIIDGVRYAHTLNPKTGYPEANSLLSASVFTDKCMTADGYATAFMVMGVKKAFSFAETDSTLEAYFIYSNDSGEVVTRYTSGLKDILEEL
ncbi:MAG: FAD:protein FMN transferase [Bacteroidetes bacterium]|nr:FAD:protein FMN transferase [Bacteroidota bacterium]